MSAVVPSYLFFTAAVSIPNTLETKYFQACSVSCQPGIIPTFGSLFNFFRAYLTVILAEQNVCQNCFLSCSAANQANKKHNFHCKLLSFLEEKSQKCFKKVLL